MKTVNIKIPYGKKDIAFSMPKDRLVGVLKKKKASRGDAGQLFLKSIDKSTAGGAALKGILTGKKKILIVVPDNTRHAHLKEILPHLLKKIDGPSRSINIIVATGLHKKHSEVQLKELLGSGVVKRYRVLCHRQDAKLLSNLGCTKRDVPIVVNKNLLEHDLVISVGVVEPHLYAGYSGGAKTVAIGLAGKEVIDATHGITFLDHPLTRVGSITGNPFQDTLWEIAGRIPSLIFSVNVVNDADGKALRVFSGETEGVFKKSVEFAKTISEINVDTPADIVICGIGYPKDINLYQASRAINYIANVDRPIIKKRGVLIVAAELKEGVGASPVEELFYETLKGMRSPKAFVSNTRKNGCVAGEHRAYMVAGPLVDYNVLFVCARHEDFMGKLPFRFFDSVSSALKHAETITGIGSAVYVVPRALATIAKLK